MRRDELIDKILKNPDEAPSDHSLRGRSLRHTDNDYIPKTLTPYEWLEYYEQHGVPDTHKNYKNTKESKNKLNILQRLIMAFKG